MDRPVVPISDPRHLTRLRRASTLQIFCLIAAGIVNFAAYRYILPPDTRVFYPSTCALLACGIFWLTIRSFRLPPRTVAHLPQPHRSITHITVALTFVSPMIAISSHPIFPATAYAAMLGAPITIIGLTILLGGLLSARPGPPACPKCRYPLAGLPLPTPCPECARPLTEADRQSFTPVSRIDAKAAYTGGLIACIGLTLSFLILGAPNTLYRALPGPVHRLLAASEVPALHTLDTTALTPDQRATLAERILDERARRKDPIDLTPQVDWLAASIAAGLLDESFAHRYAAEGLTIEIIHDEPVDPDQPIRISIRGTPPFKSAHSLMTAYYFAGFRFSDESAVEQETSLLTLYALDSTFADRDARAREFARGDISDEPGRIPTHSTVIESPTRVSTRVLVVVYPQPWPPSPTITWHDDDTYTITPTPITTVELTAETTLEPPDPKKP